MTMATMKQIHDFAIKWRNAFREQNGDTPDIEEKLGKECGELGFDMDDGASFAAFYGYEAFEYDELERIIDTVTDASILGAAIYSQWKRLTQWDDEAFLMPENRGWFVLALNRLAVISTGEALLFQGTLQKVRIVSQMMPPLSMLPSQEDVEQHVTINRQGHVWVSRYGLGRDGKIRQKGKTKRLTIKKSRIHIVLDILAAYFERSHTVETTNRGEWAMEMTNTEGTAYTIGACLGEYIDDNGMNLSTLVRHVIGMDDLFVFDGRPLADSIQKITIDYHRQEQIQPDDVAAEMAGDYGIWDYVESLVIDRAMSTITYLRHIGDGCTITNRYEIEGAVDALFEQFDAEDLFAYRRGNPPDVVQNFSEKKEYTITVDYERRPQLVIKGSYDKYDLPEDFAYFAETLFEFMYSWGLGDILNPGLYGRPKRRKSEYIYCSVIFYDGGKSYYYLTDDDTIMIGDIVLVPAGEDNEEKFVKVVAIDYFTKEQAPLPLEKTKKIIRKCTEADFEKED